MNNKAIESLALFVLAIILVAMALWIGFASGQPDLIATSVCLAVLGIISGSYSFKTMTGK